MSGLHFDHTTAMIQFNAHVTVSHPSFGVGISNHSSFSRYKPPEGKAQMASKYLSNAPVWKKSVAVSEIHWQVLMILNSTRGWTSNAQQDLYNFTQPTVSSRGSIYWETHEIN